MADFLKAYPITAKSEGGYVNDKNDTGGETFKGISRKNFPAWEGWRIIELYKQSPDADFISRINKSDHLEILVKAFYKQNFWDSLSLDQLNDQRIANELYDTGVNMGTGRAALFFQRTLNVINRNGSLFPDLKLDGQIGGKTIQAFNGLALNDKYMVWKLLNCLQGEKYIDICEANPSQEKFMRSWASRVFETVN